jgi:glycosyltransferase involved in cell wall biosynthesis
VVVPVHNGGASLERCLRGIRESTYRDLEIIVVDDGSVDESARIAEEWGAQVVRQARPFGPAAARNAGVHCARGEIIFFLDADVRIQPESLARAIARFDADPELSALFGSYDEFPAAPGLVSQYRNLLHHFVHQQGEFRNEVRDVRTFWTGCGAIRRADFLEAGGFDPRLYRRPAIEDIELGYRLTALGRRVVLARDVLATHLKRWTLREVIATDLFRRGVPWMLLLLRSRTQERDLNVTGGQRLSVLAAGAAIALGVAGVLWPGSLVASAAALGVIGWLNRSFYAFLARRRGFGFALASFGPHFCYFTCCGLSVVIASIIHMMTQRQIRTSTRDAEERPAAHGVPRPHVASMRKMREGSPR